MNSPAESTTVAHEPPRLTISQATACWSVVGVTIGGLAFIRSATRVPSSAASRRSIGTRPASEWPVASSVRISSTV